MNNDFLKKLEPQHTREMVDCMYEKIYAAEQLVIQEGEPGNYLYVLAGKLQMFLLLAFHTFVILKSKYSTALHFFIIFLSDLILCV